ncbi:hypothetical protein B0A50_01561 [Salinomyces thailandicus]|uniref:Uncharacterized protein n=1 Tax=Salinomyces thailandicus TaxID=706561 RepID=A0A4U0UAN1_9PEZI|nr:hypothetical protein B0A50_01561 [Salinomyces thailandica]
MSQYNEQDPAMQREAAEQREMNMASNKSEMGAGRRAEDISAASQEYEADRQKGAGEQDLHSHHGASTGLEQSEGYTAAAEAGALLSLEDIRNMDRATGAAEVSPATRGVASVPVDASRAPQLVGDPESGFSARPGGMAGGVREGVVGQGGVGGASGVQAGADAGSDQEKLFGGHHNTMMGDMLDPRLKR